MVSPELDNTEIPPTTVPAACMLSLRGMPDDSEWVMSFQEALRVVIGECGRAMDLSRLDGITVGADYDDALASVDLGYESTLAKDYTKTDELIGVGKMLRVRRGGEVRVHVVLNASVLSGLVDPSGPEFRPSLNILCHELAHVCVDTWFENHSPGIMLQPHQGDWAVSCMQMAAHAIWEEYAACRLAAPYGDCELVVDRYIEGVQGTVRGAVERAREKIKAYRSHGQVDQLLVETAQEICAPLRMIAYLAGHIDGIELPFNWHERCPELEESELSDVLSSAIASFRSAWETRHAWQGMRGVDDIIAVILRALEITGAVVTLSQEGQGSRVDVPFSAATLPNGEADMALLRSMGRIA